MTPAKKKPAVFRWWPQSSGEWVTVLGALIVSATWALSQYTAYQNFIGQVTTHTTQIDQITRKVDGLGSSMSRLEKIATKTFVQTLPNRVIEADHAEPASVGEPQ